MLTVSRLHYTLTDTSELFIWFNLFLLMLMLGYVCFILFLLCVLHFLGIATTQGVKPTSTKIFTQLDLKPQSTHTYCAACTVLILKALLPLVQLQAALGISDFSAALGSSDFSAALGLSRRLARARLAQALGTVCRA